MAHEDLTREEHIEGSSDRSFGFVFAAVFGIIAAWPLFHGAGLRWWAAGVAGAFAIVAVVMPGILAVPNRLWMKGMWRLFGKDFMRHVLRKKFWLPQGVFMSPILMRMMAGVRRR
jgi:hypothetical protein